MTSGHIVIFNEKLEHCNWQQVGLGCCRGSRTKAKEACR